MRRALSAAGLLLIAACAPKSVQYPVFPPLSYRTELPRVVVYPPLTMQGKEVVVVARPIMPDEACLRVVDADGYAWHETCWEGGDSRRITFRPVKVGRHRAYLSYPRPDGGVLYLNGATAELCVLGEDADCP